MGGRTSTGSGRSGTGRPPTCRITLSRYLMPAGRSVVEGGEIPYQPWAAAKKAENFAKRAELDPLQ